MQWDQAGVLVTPVRWYFVPPGTPPLPFPHLYGSSNWDTDGVIDLGPGERWDSLRPYSKGAPPGPQLTTGEFCGSLDWWQNGVPSDAPLLPTNLLGQPDCCIQDGGLAVGGTSVVIMQPPNSGGLQIGGLSTVSLRSSYSGGIAVGGTSVLYPPVLVTGGLLVGGTSRCMLDYPGNGGMEVGGTSSVYLVWYGNGGNYVGGLSVQEFVHTSSGGVEVGATSVVSLQTSDTGGVEIGGTSTVVLLCQPNNITIFNHPTLYRVSTSTFWPVVNQGLNSAVFFDPTTHGVLWDAAPSGTPCLSSSNAMICTLELTIGYRCQLIAYNSSTNTGTWVIPSSSPTYPGETFLLFGG